MNFIGTTMNQSPTVTAPAAAAIADGSFLAVVYDADGNLALAGAGAPALGLLIAETGEVKANDRLAVQIKDIGRWIAGSAVKAGDELASDAAGKAVKAGTGQFILAVALEPAIAGQPVAVQIIKAGYKPAAS